MSLPCGGNWKEFDDRPYRGLHIAYVRLEYHNVTDGQMDGQIW